MTALRLRRQHAIDLLRFAVVGASGFVVDTAVVYTLREPLGLYGAGLVSYLVAATWVWWFNRIWTYAGRSSGSLLGQWARFMVVNLGGFVLNRGTYALLVAASGQVRAWPVLAVAAGSVAGMFANFFLSRRLVFR